MSYQVLIEAGLIAAAAFAVVKFVALQHHKLTRINRGLRLLNYVVDRANEREALMTEAIEQASRARAA